ncbi:MAG: type II toxin-antitoxin system VapC family toxin [bacterium]|nr:type II toxin-antitoxin system VapC family toxin [bacterium]
MVHDLILVTHNVTDFTDFERAVRSLRSRPDRAYRDVDATFRLAHWCRREMPPALIHDLVANEIARRASRLTNLLMQTSSPTAEQKARILAEARSMDPYETFIYAHHGERAVCYTSLAKSKMRLGGLLLPSEAEFPASALAVVLEGGKSCWRTPQPESGC